MKPTTPSQPKAPIVWTTLETPLLKTELSSAMGLPQHWWMKKYFLNPDRKGPNLDLLQGSAETPALALFLFPGNAATAPYYEVAEPGAKKVLYRGRHENLALEQSVAVSDKDYSLDVELRVENQGSSAVTMSPGLRLANIQSAPPKKGFLFFQEAPNYKTPFYRVGTKVERRHDEAKLGALNEAVGAIPWAGLEDRYFLRVILAQNVSPQNRVSYGKVGEEVFTTLQYAAEPLTPGQKKEYRFSLYLGPKDPALLKAFGEAHLDQAIDYGWFGWAAVPILYVLKFFESIFKNWGLAIIALTIAFKILLNPLTKKSMASMKGMQALQPQLQKIREKYKDDRERLNLETMNLFRTHKVNPMGGCLPMLLQMPIYIALYKVLYNATDLYHAPFFWFYRDLSAPDPYFILPILLGIFMVLQQKMTPSPSADPTQAKMMMIMPVLFSAFMLFLPVGLVLYIFVNTLMTVAQQYMYQHNLTLRSLFKGRNPAGP
jgi:membrane protein insertase, YidC/Oxa1 family, N-terminal domain